MPTYPWTNIYTEPVFVDLFRSPEIDSRRAGTTTLFGAPGRQATQADEIDSSDSIPGLHKHLQIRALAPNPKCRLFLKIDQ